MVKAGYVQDDTLNIPDSLKKMTKEELKKHIEKLEKNLFGKESVKKEKALV